MDSEGRTISIVDPHRDGQLFIVRGDEKLTAFLELEKASEKENKMKIYVFTYEESDEFNCEHCSEGARERRQFRHFRVERVTARGLLHSGQRERLWLRQFSHSFRILYDGSAYQTQFNIRRDSVSRLMAANRRF